jgi:hypothetical protein
MIDNAPDAEWVDRKYRALFIVVGEPTKPSN